MKTSSGNVTPGAPPTAISHVTVALMVWGPMVVKVQPQVGDGAFGSLLPCSYGVPGPAHGTAPSLVHHLTVGRAVMEIGPSLAVSGLSLPSIHNQVGRLTTRRLSASGLV